MKEILYTISHNIATTLEMQCACQPNDVVTKLEKDGFSLFLVYVENKNQLIFLTEIGVVPSHEKNAFYEAVLIWNGECMHNKGFSYALDKEQELVTFQACIEMQHQTEQNVYAIFEAYMAELDNALDKLHQLTLRLA